MVIARTKLTIHDDLLRPWPKVIINYKGPDPKRIYTEVPNLLATVFKVHTGQIQEKKSYWQKGDPERFKVSWEMHKDLDKWSFYIIKVDLDGEISKGVGYASITIDGALRTEYPQDTIWEKSLLYEFLRMMWHRMFYEKKREEYLKEGKRLIATFVEELKRLTHGER